MHLTSKLKAIASNLTLLIFSFVAVLILFEIAVRVFLPNAGRDGVRHKSFCEYDKLLGWKHTPNASNIFRTDEFSVHLSFNSRGIRGPEYSYAKKADEFRILILGDSFAEGYTVEFDQLFSEVLKKTLTQNNTTGRSYEVINSGVGGYSTDQEYLFYQTEGKKYQPDMVMLLFYSNDVWFNNQAKYWRGYKPLFRLEAGDLKLVNVPVPRPAVSKPIPFQRDFVWANINKELFEYSHLYRLVYQRIKKLPDMLRTPIKLGVMKENESSLKDLPPSYRVWGKAYDADVRRSWELTEALLVDLRKAVESANERFVVFYVPPSFAIYEHLWNRTKKAYGLSDESWSPHQVRTELAAICQRNGIDLIDATPYFLERAQKAPKGSPLLYFEKNGHWTPAGNRLVAKILYSFITQQTWFPAQEPDDEIAGT